MRKLLLILLCLPMIGFGQNNTSEMKEKTPFNAYCDFCEYLYKNSHHRRNVFNISVNSQNHILLKSLNNSVILVDISELKNSVSEFLSNNGENAALSEKIESAIFRITSDGCNTVDYEIIRIISNVYSKLNIPINERKICYLKKDSPELKNLQNRFPPPPPPPPPNLD